MAEPSRKPSGTRGTPIRVPRDTEELQCLNYQEIEQLAATTQLQLSHQHHRRSKLLRAEQVDTNALAEVGAQIKATGNLLGAVLQRRGQLRSQRRRELGCMPERNAAIAIAVDSRLSGRAWRQVQNEAARILAVAAADLGQEPDARRPLRQGKPSLSTNELSQPTVSEARRRELENKQNAETFIAASGSGAQRALRQLPTKS